MAKMKEQKLFAEFPPVTTGQWEEAIAKDLKGADYAKKLIWRTAEGFDVRPYYRAEDLKGLKYLGSGPAEYPFVRGTKKNNNWLVTQTIKVRLPREANNKALRAIHGGAQSVSFIIDNNNFTVGDVEELMHQIDMTKTQIVFRVCSTPKIAGIVLDMMDANNVEKEKADVHFILDPLILRLSLSGGFANCPDCSASYNTISSYIKRATESGYKKLRFIGVSAHNFQSAGSTIVQELAFGLAVGHEYLADLHDYGLTTDQIADSIDFSFSVSSNYFMEIAKFRAARMLWAQIVRAYKPEYSCSEKMHINAITSQWNLTSYDPYVNMLRGTTEAMSAAIAGVNSMEVLPFNFSYEHPTDFSARIARNTQLLLKYESHFDSVVDPSGGSYYIENLTKSIAEQAWELFKQIEEMGGYTAAFGQGVIHDMIEASAEKKNKDIATRRQILIGTNQYPNFGERAEECHFEELITPKLDLYDFICEAEPNCRPLKIYRGAQAFEKLRARVDNSYVSPSAFMLTVGSLGMARARAQFAGNFFGCVGIKPIDNTFFQSVEEGVKAAIDSLAQIVVICAADDDYATLAPEAFKLLGDKALFVVAGAPSCQAELEAQGIKNFISVKSNVLETLEYYVEQLGIK